ncbi:hypothetical protein DSO57_1027406 [Entomophthora muscae]|uniref:Uncharacterized protein n=1 Tax=Entomophthora muscae TaxID=34485 RepID=A0ACC2T217_9FUNG|nr:hypothetical protein DSO57_1027406 [Entomophthora muscae]
MGYWDLSVARSRNSPWVGFVNAMAKGVNSWWGVNSWKWNWRIKVASTRRISAIARLAVSLVCLVDLLSANACAGTDREGGVGGGLVDVGIQPPLWAIVEGVLAPSGGQSMEG